MMVWAKDRDGRAGSTSGCSRFGSTSGRSRTDDTFSGCSGFRDHLSGNSTHTRGVQLGRQGDSDNEREPYDALGL